MDKETFSGILDDLKNRFGSRFILSFVVSWLLFNWRISISLFWYDTTQLKAEGCKSIFEFITNQLKHNQNGTKVFWSALIYTLGLPVSKGILNIWDDIIFDLRNWAKTKLVRSQDARTIMDLNNRLAQINDIKILNGYWKVKSSSDFYLNSSGQYDMYIEDGNIFVSDTGDRILHCTITNFFYDVNNSKIIFIKDKDSSKRYYDRYAVNILEIKFFDSNKKKMIGTENGLSVEYERYKS